jgi:hypothetical protein
VSRSVAILGCGPSGLLAAHAVAQMGHRPYIYSIKKKSVMPGAMYLHERIDGINDYMSPDGHVVVRQIGTREGYAAKVYGDPDAPVSWDTFGHGSYPAWSMAEMYDKLWDMYSPFIFANEVTPYILERIRQKHVLTISSIPAKALCKGDHEFAGAKVWISDQAWRELSPDENVILYNGDPTDHWYRTSMIFGHGATESTEPMPGAFEGIKPTETDCDCQPAVKRVGRFGQWKKGVLVHHAYRQALEIVSFHLGPADVVMP